MNDRTLLLCLYLVGGLLQAGLSIPLLLEKIPPNPLYGFRLPKTFANPATWYAANKYSAVRLFWSGLILVIAAAGLYFIPTLSLDAYALLCLAVFSAAFGFGLYQSLRYLRSLRSLD